MVYDIVVGRTEDEKRVLGTKATIYIGKHFVKMGETTSLSSKILMDVVKSHVILVTGKRGSGKSNTLGIIAEEISRLPKDISKNISVILFDTLGIFWTMKYPNTRQEKLLASWDLSPEGMDIDVYVPKGFFNELKKKGFPCNYPFSLKTSGLGTDDWCGVFDIDLLSSHGILVDRIVSGLKGPYSLDDIISKIQKDKKADINTKNAVENKFIAAKSWGLFDELGLDINDITLKRKVSIIDLSSYSNVAGNWNIKGLVIGLLSKKLLLSRIESRKKEELESIKSESRYLLEEEESREPLVWMLIDEAHEFLPRLGNSPATHALIQLLREGRQPGITVVLATQQPGEIVRDVITQSDIIISHRITARLDIEALNSMMQTYLIDDIRQSLNTLPKLKGSAIILDDNSERIYPIMVHPKRSWHGGESPSAYKAKRQLFEKVA